MHHNYGIYKPTIDAHFYSLGSLDPLLGQFLSRNGTFISFNTWLIDLPLKLMTSRVENSIKNNKIYLIFWYV